MVPKELRLRPQISLNLGKILEGNFQNSWNKIKNANTTGKSILCFYRKIIIALEFLLTALMCDYLRFHVVYKLTQK